MKSLTFTSDKEHFELNTKIHQPTARKDIKSLSDAAVILYEAGSRTGVEDRRKTNRFSRYLFY